MIRFCLRDKAPEGDDVYTIDMTKHIGQDTLTGTPTAQVLDGTIVVHTLDLPDTHTARFWISDGQVGEVGRARIHMETTQGRELDAEVVIGVR